ncbi:damage-inducible mutagenesis protein, partial [Rhizobium phaseoli]
MTISVATSNAVLDELREKIVSLEGAGMRRRSVL